MKMSGRRESSNVVDKRSGGKTKAAAGGIGGLGVVGVLLYFMLSGGNVDPATLQRISNAGNTQNTGATTTAPETRNADFYKNNSDFANQEELKKFTSQILASTEDVWGAIFKKQGKQYAAPKMTWFTDAVDTACGHATSNVGPFYCSGDQTLYIDLEFLETMKKKIGSDGDFAFAYVIAHEVGHHITYLMGDMAKYKTQEVSLKKAGKTAEANLVSVQIELQADCYAGVWGNVENETFKSLESSDFMEAFHAAKTVGDDTLGNTHRDTFSHGSAKMRQTWFKTGFNTGDMKQCNTYNYASLDALENKK